MQNKTVKQLSIKRIHLVGAIMLWWFLFMLLAVNTWNPFGLLYVLGVPFILYVPGMLTVILLRLTHLDVWARIVLAVGFSILEVMLLALLGNTLMPMLGVSRPLDTLPVAWELSTLVLVLLSFAWQQLQTVSFSVPRYCIADTKLDLVFLLIPPVFIVMSVFGAVRLNNGADSSLTMLLLFGIGLYSAFMLRFANRVGRNVIPFALFCMSLALLLMTALRGWHISGHDIQREFFVFQLAKDAGLWSMGAYLDAYNACLSITILPTLFSNMLHIPDVYIYKVLFQIMFAVAPIIVFLISRKWLAVRYSFLAGLLFMAFPTFFQDMPFLVRQEVAFLFYGLMLYVLFEERITLWLRRLLFVSMGVGVILSHYSTTYTILFVLVLTSISMPAVQWLVRKYASKRFFQKSALGTSVVRGAQPQQRKITFAMVGMLMVVGLLWTSVITGTDGHAREVSHDIWVAIQNGFEGDARSVDVLVFFTFGRVLVDRTLEEYVHDVVDPRRMESPQMYYATSTYSTYPLVTLSQTELPVTMLGRSTFAGVTLENAVTFFGRVLAKLMQAAVIFGLVYVLFRRRWLRLLDTEFYTLAMYAMVFVALCIVLPLLSKEYGVFRALQQSMFVLAPFMVVGILILGSIYAHLFERTYTFLSRGKMQVGSLTPYMHGAVGVFGVLFFLYATGFMTQFVGGNLPAVHLNNVGDDYRHYVTTDDEFKAIHWLENRLKQDSLASGGEVPIVQADRFGQKKLQSVLGTYIAGDIFPGSINRDAYVFAGPAVLHSRKAVVRYDGVLITYAYPVAFLKDNKDLVYSNGGVHIYK